MNFQMRLILVFLLKSISNYNTIYRCITFRKNHMLKQLARKPQFSIDENLSRSATWRPIFRISLNNRFHHFDITNMVFFFDFDRIVHVFCIIFCNQGVKFRFPPIVTINLYSIIIHIIFQKVLLTFPSPWIWLSNLNTFNYHIQAKVSNRIILSFEILDIFEGLSSN